MPFRIVDGGDIMVTARRPHDVLVRPKAAAWILFNFFRCDEGERGQAARTELRLSNSRRARPIRIPWYPPLCRGVRVTRIAVSPFESQRRAVFAQ
jgi:hypothetical protein